MLPWLLGALILGGGYFLFRRDQPKPEGSPLIQPYGRDNVRLAIDQDAKLIGPEPQAGGPQLFEFPRPKELGDQGNDATLSARYAPLETHQWVFEAKLEEIVERADHDYYLVLRLGKDQIIAEAPDPIECTGSPFEEQIRDVRQKLQSLEPSQHPQKLDRRVRLRGIGFFGKPGRRPDGSKSNGARISPTTRIEFLD